MASVRSREQAEAEAFQSRDRRYKLRKERTALISFRIKPEIRAMLEKMADAEGTSMIDIVEKAVLLLNKVMKGEKLTP